MRAAGHGLTAMKTTDVACEEVGHREPFGRRGRRRTRHEQAAEPVEHQNLRRRPLLLGLLFDELLQLLWKSDRHWRLSSRLSHARGCALLHYTPEAREQTNPYGRRSAPARVSRA